MLKKTKKKKTKIQKRDTEKMAACGNPQKPGEDRNICSKVAKKTDNRMS